MNVSENVSISNYGCVSVCLYMCVNTNIVEIVRVDKYLCMCAHER